MLLRIGEPVTLSLARGDVWRAEVSRESFSHRAPLLVQASCTRGPHICCPSIWVALEGGNEVAGGKGLAAAADIGRRAGTGLMGQVAVSIRLHADA